MPRGFHRDEQATLAARFEDHRSFASKPKIIKGECDTPKPHLVLYGLDKGPIRAKIFQRNREENGGLNKCWKCGKPVSENREFWPREFVGQWDHVRNSPGKRCDCAENGRVSCSACHTERHPRVRWGAGKQVEETA